MNISNRFLALSDRRARSAPKSILKHQSLDFVPSQRRDEALLATRSGYLARGGARPSPTEIERLLGTNDLVDEFYLKPALLAAMPVCRISIRSPSRRERGCATGVMISPRILLTNHHVFTSAEEAGPSIAEFNYTLDIAGNPEPSFRFALMPGTYFFNDADLDFAVVAVRPVAEDGQTPLASFGYHRLIATKGKVTKKEWMTIVQHPGGARRQFAIRENQCVSTDLPDVMWYKSDTAQGSSGSPVFNDSLRGRPHHPRPLPRRPANRVDHAPPKRPSTPRLWCAGSSRSCMGKGTRKPNGCATRCGRRSPYCRPPLGSASSSSRGAMLQTLGW